MSYGDTIKDLRSQCGPCYREIKRHTGLTAEEVAWEIYIEAQNYLVMMNLRAEMETNKGFWNWWKMLWYSHDAEFLQIKGLKDRKRYLLFHHHKALCMEMPSPLRKLIKEQIKQK